MKLYEPHQPPSSRVVPELVRKVGDFQVDRPHCSSGSDRHRKNYDLALGSEPRAQGFVPTSFKLKEQTSVKRID